MKHYTELPVTLRFITDEPLNLDEVSHGFQMSGIKGLAEFVKGKPVETPNADWTTQHKTMAAMARLFGNICP